MTMVAPLQITTDRVSLTLSDEYQPVLTLQSVKVADQDATQIVAVDYAVTEASLAALLLGELKLKRLVGGGGAGSDFTIRNGAGGFGPSA